MFHGNVECPKCWRTHIDFVACSDKCAKQLAPNAQVIE
jgi:hypothetical protein